MMQSYALQNIFPEGESEAYDGDIWTPFCPFYYKISVWFNSWVCIYLLNWYKREMTWLKIWVNFFFFFKEIPFGAKICQSLDVYRLKLKWKSCGNLSAICKAIMGNTKMTVKKHYQFLRKRWGSKLLPITFILLFYSGNLNWSDSQEDRLKFQTHRFSFHSFV